jgi:hydrogenase-4 component B
MSLELLGAALLLGLALAALPMSRARFGGTVLYSASAALSLALCAGGIAALLGHAALSVRLPLGLPWLGMNFRIDALGAFFLVVVNLGGAAASLYSIGYDQHERAPLRVRPFFPAFLAAMNLVVMADDAFTFLFSWELMSLASWALVMAQHRDEANARAGQVYLVMASFGTLALLLAFGLLAGPEGAYGFAAIRGAHHAAWINALVLALALLGAGSKAGIVPLHVWLPLAHPAAPSPASALMSGVMTKVAVYGLVRIVFDLLGPPDWWPGLVVLALGGVTAVMGVLYALMEHDLKRLLAYHTVENIGIIFIGLGLALAFRADAMTEAAALALTAALFHVFNHMLFKSLLFFGAGAVQVATGERDMERLGGLIRRMPVTSFAFLIGCISISALPPFNGFVSEWLTFQAILLSPDLPQWGLKIMIPGVGAMLALAAALAAACFVKAFGITFLGRPRSDAAAGAGEADRFARAAMLAFAAICLIAGVLPGLVIDALSPVAQALIGGRMPVQSANPWLSIVPVATSRSSYNGLLVFVFMVLSASVAAASIHRLATRALRRGPAWDCGFPDPSPMTQYSAGSFAQPIRRVFGTVFAAREVVAMPPPLSAAAATIHVRLRDLVWDFLYAPVGAAVSFAADHLNHMQFLTIRRYLSLVFVALVALLGVLALWL